MKQGILVALVLSLWVSLLVGCGSGSGFVSDDPTYRGAQSFGGGGADGGAAAADASATPAPGDNGAQRAIEEADIVKIVGTRLYALSRYGGLSIIDISVRDQLKLLGRQRMEAIPFEMYVVNDVVYAMLSSYERWDAAGWVETSELVALDTADPAHIKQLATFDIPGELADSRMVGQVMYVVTFRDGYCYNCGSTPSTTVTSFNVTPSSITQVDRIDYSTTNGYGYAWWKRSVAVTPTRMYVAGPEWNTYQPQGSVIQVIDISDPSGLMKKGADVPVAGQITSRWQMDEYQGVLRVISQPWQWSAPTVSPQVQTFTVNSSTSIVPLGRTDIVLPMQEALQSVRFDATRAYAITVERKDPLFTIDLSNPAAPKQVGQLQMPGWIYYMEPRGDRLLGLGFDNANSVGTLNVSLFDVSDLANPTMIKRVSFAQGWSQLPEDQDRIQKAFQVLDSDGLILVPFASYGSWNGTSCTPGQSGIQIIDYSGNDLVLRGVANQDGQPRRAFLWDSRLFAMSDRHVTTYDITNRDLPQQKVEFDLSTPAYRVVSVGSNFAQLSSDWWTGAATLAIVPQNDAENAVALGKLSLVDLAPSEQWRCGWGSVWTEWYSADLFAHGNYLVIAVPVYAYAYGYGGSSAQLVVGVVDLSDPTKPAIAGKMALPLQSNSYYGGYYGGYYGYYGSGGVLASGTGTVQAGDALAYIETATTATTVPVTGMQEVRTSRKVHVIDLSNPAALKLSATVDLGSTSRGWTPLLVSGTQILTTRWDPVFGMPEKVRFFVDRIDVSDSAAPKRLASVNVPGSLLLADGARWVTMDYRRVVTPDPTMGSDCWQRYGAWYDNGSCIAFERTLNLLEVSGSTATLKQTLVPPQQNLGSVIASGDRVYVTRYPSYSSVYYGGSYSQQVKDGGLFVYGESDDGLSLVTYADGDYLYPVAVDGTRIALAEDFGVGFYDTSTAGMRDVGHVRLRGWGYADQVLIEGNRATCALGDWGIQTVSLAP